MLRPYAQVLLLQYRRPRTVGEALRLINNAKGRIIDRRV